MQTRGMEQVGFHLTAAFTPDLTVPIVEIGVHDLDEDGEAMEEVLALRVSADDATQLAMSLLRTQAGATFSLSAEYFARGLTESGDVHGAKTIRNFMAWFGGAESWEAELPETNHQ